MVTIVAGCSSGSQRFSNISSHHRIAPQLNIANSMSTDPGMLSYGGEMIQSTELPPVEPSDDSSIDDNSPYNFHSRVGEFLLMIVLWGRLHVILEHFLVHK